MRARAAWAGAVSLAVAGCAYFNGLYNANRLARDAVRAEQDGRIDEARSLWSRAAVKAESVAVKHPSSKYHDDALLLMGRALSELDDCGRAVPPLRTAVLSSSDRDVRRRARLLVGRCFVQLGQPDSAIALLDPLVGEEDGTDRVEALLWRGRAYMLLGMPTLAVRDLEAAGDSAPALDLAAAYAARDGVERANAFVDSLADRVSLSREAYAAVLVADARRLDDASLGDRADKRFRQAAEVAGDAWSGRVARAELARRALGRSGASIDSLEAWERPIARVAESGADLPWSARTYVRVLEEAEVALKRPDAPHADLRLFRAAELVRDSLNAAPLARGLFDQVRSRYPQSPIAPKALLAAAFLGGVRGDSLRALLEGRYPASPYALALQGEGDAAFLALEDSLKTLLKALGADSAP